VITDVFTAKKFDLWRQCSPAADRWLVILEPFDSSSVWEMSVCFFKYRRRSSYWAPWFCQTAVQEYSSYYLIFSKVITTPGC